MWTREDFTLKRFGIAAVCTIIVWLGWMGGRDIYSGEWHTYPAKVTGKQFIPDRSHWQIISVCHSGPGNSINCHPELHYIIVPPEYHIFVLEPGGQSHDFDDSKAFIRYESGTRIMLRARVGGLTGWRWLLHIKT